MLVLDLDMPDIDGFGFARLVCATPSLADTPMVLLTSSAQRGEAERTQQAGIETVLTGMLGSLGYRADVARNGRDGLEAVRRNHYAAILMDCQMPVMDGYKATEQLRAIDGTGHRTRVIAVTATEGAR